MQNFQFIVIHCFCPMFSQFISNQLGDSLFISLFSRSLSSADRIYVLLSRNNYLMERSRIFHGISSKLSSGYRMHLHMVIPGNWPSDSCYAMLVGYLLVCCPQCRDHICTVQRNLQFNTLSSKWMQQSSYLFESNYGPPPTWFIHFVLNTQRL